MQYTNTTIDYEAPEGFTSPGDGHRFVRTEDGRFYAAVRLGVGSDAGAWIDFDLHVQLSEADWNALREGTAKFVTGEIREELPREIIGEYCQFSPTPDKPFAAEASISLAPEERLDGVFHILAARELEAA